jgi:biofilm PGA synthesis lipoprotein PgaB
MQRRVFLQTLLASQTVPLATGVLANGTAAVESMVTQPSHLTVQIPKGQFVALCMHDVRDAAASKDKDPYAITTQQLAALFDWMKQNHWQPISLQQVLDAHEGKVSLPGNAVLLSWDDGLASIYSKVFPLLKAYNYPGMFALETDWLTRVQLGETVVYQGEDSASSKQPEKSPESNAVLYNGQKMGASGFATWAQLREMQASGLVEFASHTNDQHHGILANPQGNVEPAAIARRYLPTQTRYETDAEFHNRIFNDLRFSANIIEREIGVRPRAIVWPYGAANQEVQSIAAEAGLPISFGLGYRRLDNQIQTSQSIGRLIVMNDPSPVSIEDQVFQFLKPVPGVERAVQVDLDYIFDLDPNRINNNLSALLDRIKAMQVRTVYLQAFADPEGTGTPREVYFPNTVLPVRADLFNRVAWQLRTRAGVRVFAWLPLLAYQLPDVAQQTRLAVKITIDGKNTVSPHRDYHRLSPFLSESVALVGQIYADLGKNCTGIHGLLIHDDAYLCEDEDANVLDPLSRWPGTNQPLSTTLLTARQKTMALIAFGQAVTRRLAFYVDDSTNFSVARNLYARVVLEPNAEARFAQALAPFLEHYDHVALMAMPYLDGTQDPPAEWLTKLAQTVAQTPGALKKVVFQLQAKNWQTNEWIDGATLKSWMTLLIRMGASNLAYYPDDFLGNHPQLKPLFEGMSLNAFPYTH